MFSKFFIERPVLANVIAFLMVLLGGVAILQLPISQYPPITPPTVQVIARYPGASARTLVQTVALPIEQQVNGVENMLYMQSTCTNDGTYSLIVTFKIGTDPDFAQVLVQNRVAAAMAQLPRSVQTQGVVTSKKSTAILQIITLTSPHGKYDALFLSNYATLRLQNELERLPGVGGVTVFRHRPIQHAGLAGPGQNAGALALAFRGYSGSAATKFASDGRSDRDAADSARRRIFNSR